MFRRSFFVFFPYLSKELGMTTANIYSHVTEDDIRKMQEAKDAAD